MTFFKSSASWLAILVYRSIDHIRRYKSCTYNPMSLWTNFRILRVKLGVFVRILVCLANAHPGALLKGIPIF